MQLDYVRGNFSAEDEAFRLQGAVGGSSAWAMTHMSQAASLLSAHIHIHGILSGARPECLNEHLQLLFLMSLRRMKHLLHSQLRHLWLVFQGTAELVRQGAGKWLSEVVELFEADIRTYESIMVNWRSKEEIEADGQTDGVGEGNCQHGYFVTHHFHFLVWRGRRGRRGRRWDQAVPRQASC